MMCCWNEVISVLPEWMRDDVDRLYRHNCQEIHMRCDSPPEIVYTGGVSCMTRRITQDDIRFCINSACEYSPWTSVYESKGFISIPGGHRLGLCGKVTIKEGNIIKFQEIISVCIRIARDIPNAGSDIRPEGSILVLGAPGWGKTTLLRNLARLAAQSNTVGVVDEREELFPKGFRRGKRMDVLSGCPKTLGIEMVLRTMSPEYIVVDEITAESDSIALETAYGCGVNLIASVHASSIDDLHKREVYRHLVAKVHFDQFVILSRDRSYFVKTEDDMK